MTRFLSIVMVCLLLTLAACSSDSTPAVNNNTPDNSAKGDLDPTAMQLDQPPVNGKLPADLRPPI